MNTSTTARVSIGDLLDRLLDAGVVVAGQVAIGLADIELILLDLRVLLTGVESARQRDTLPDGLLHQRTSTPDRPRATPPPALPSRVDLDDERPERGVVGLVLLLVDILRELIEGQALARLEGGSLTADEVERLGRALHLLDTRISALHDWLDTSRPDLFGTEGDPIPWR